MIEEAVRLPSRAELEASANWTASLLNACERARAIIPHLANVDDAFALKLVVDEIALFARRKRLQGIPRRTVIETVRRAERALALAVRRGQDAGEIGRQGGNLADNRARRAGRTVQAKRSPTEFLGRGPGKAPHDIYQLVDGVTDEQFEYAIRQAWNDRNLCRINVIRHLRGERQRKAARPEHLRGTRHHDPNRIVEQTIADSGVPEELAGEIEYAALDRTRLEGWISSLSDVIKSLTTLKRNLKKELTHE